MQQASDDLVHKRSQSDNRRTLVMNLVEWVALVEAYGQVFVR